MKKKQIITIVLIVVLLILLLRIKKKNDNIIYIEDFLDTSDFEMVNKLNKNKTNFIFEKYRYIRPLSKNILDDNEIYNIFYSTKYLNKIQNYINPKIHKSDFPIEHRFYHKESTGMNWHIDTLLYSKPQYEAIYTIKNESDSKTQWLDENDKLNEVWTKPNSILIVKAQGYKHHVTPPIIGEREILKLIYTQTNKTNENYKKEINRFNL
jgi:hypothetical protein